MNMIKWLFMTRYSRLLYQIECAKDNGQRLHLENGIVLDFSEKENDNGDQEAQMQRHSDELLWQEIFSLREKLRISVEAIKSYDPEFDDKLFLHQLNSTDYEQLMEELAQPPIGE